MLSFVSYQLKFIYFTLIITVKNISTYLYNSMCNKFVKFFFKIRFLFVLHALKNYDGQSSLILSYGVTGLPGISEGNDWCRGPDSNRHGETSEGF